MICAEETGFLGFSDLLAPLQYGGTDGWLQLSTALFYHVTALNESILSQNPAGCFHSLAVSSICDKAKLSVRQIRSLLDRKDDSLCWISDITLD
jgi:hypothetical protein